MALRLLGRWTAEWALGHQHAAQARRLPVCMHTLSQRRLCANHLATKLVYVTPCERQRCAVEEAIQHHPHTPYIGGERVVISRIGRRNRQRFGRHVPWRALDGRDAT